MAADINIRIGADLSELSKQLKKAERQLMRTGSKLKEQGKAMTQSITVPILGIGGAALKAFADIEKFENGLASMMGSSEAAKAEIEKLKEVAKDPGLSLDQAVKGSVRLQSVGIQADQARETLSAVGNAIALVGGSADDLDGVTLALQQIGSKGKVSAEEINQINERMPQIRKAMKDAFGTAATEDIQKMGLSSQEFIAGITAELQKLPKATGGLSNAFNNAGQAITQSLATVGKSINENFDVQGKINAFSERITELSAAFANLSPNVQKNIMLIGGLAAAIGPVLMVMGQMKIMGAAMFGMMRTGLSVFQPLLAAFKAMQAAQIGLNVAMLANPIGAVVVAVGALVAILAVLYKKNETVRNALNKLFEGVRAGFDFVLSVGRVIAGVLVEIGRTAFSVARNVVDVFKAIGQSIVDLLKRIPIIGKIVKFVQDAFTAVYNVIVGIFDNLPRFFAGLTAEAQNMGLKLKAGFRKIAVAAEILAKKIQRGVTIDSDARKRLSESIKKLEEEKEQLADVGKKFGQSFRDAFNKEIGTGVSKMKVKSLVIEKPVAPEPDSSSSSGLSGGGGVKSIETTTKAVEDQKAAFIDLANAQGLQSKAMTESIAPMEGMGQKLDAIKMKTEEFKTNSQVMAEHLRNFNTELTNIVNTGLSDIAAGIGEMAGQMAAGSMSMADAGRNIVGMLAGVLGQVGKLAIQTGIATAGIKVALQSLNPVAAVAGGIALVALSKFVQAKMSAVTPLAEGGILTKPVFSQGFLAGEAGPEAVIPLSKLDTMLSSARGTNQPVNVSGEFRMNGNDMVAVVKRQTRVNNRIR